jgi:NTE family protein
MNITLALGGGGAKGNAHIGVLRKLEQEGIRIRAIAGTSFGGMVAAFYASGRSPDEIEALFRGVDQSRLYGHTPEQGPSLLGLAGATKWLYEVLGNTTFNDLRLPCALTGVDLNSAREVILTEGSLVEAILATIALPGVFPTRRIQEWELVDGGVLDPVPVSVARSLAPKWPVVAVVLTAPVGKSTRTLEMILPGGFFAPIARRITRFRTAQALETFIHSMDIFNRKLTDLRLEADHPEIIVRPNVHHIQLLEKVNVSEVAKLGEQAMEAALPDLRQAVSWRARLARSIKNL